MKRAALVLLAFVAMTGTAFAHHGTHDWVATGRAFVGDLFSPVIAVTDCDEVAPSNGIDGEMVALPEGAGGHDLSLTGKDFIDFADFDIQFLDADCQYIEGSELQNNGDEIGVVPDGAVWAEVDLFLGVNAKYTLTVYDVLS